MKARGRCEMTQGVLESMRKRAICLTGFWFKVSGGQL